ncbi:MAG: type I-E CRISPR-associated protein Cas5/CasD [Cellvibrio sp. 79]|nr:MAG: type I-E CRISPR-associated protein Cas5/CasD [Cellvibrio sp. 79]
MEFLVFRLYGPMASWGEIAVGEARHSAIYPSKSAIIGLLAAALGIRREQEELQKKLTAGYWQAIKLLKAGQVLKDYHTAQAPDSVGRFRYRTRRDELIHGKERLGTVLSSREYRTDAQAIVAIKALDAAPYELKSLQQALQLPKFHLYLGRKSCPLAAPLDVQLITADNFRMALDAYVLKDLLIDASEWQSDARWLPKDKLIHYYWEGDLQGFSIEDAEFNFQQVQKLSRYDMPSSRRRWQFSPRSEYLWLHNKEVS